MKYIKYLTALLISLLCSCNNYDDQTDDQLQNDTTSLLNNKNTETDTDTIRLIIEGDNIWVREEPVTGEVIMKLNAGDVCKILEKGEKVQVKNMLDYWYKIKFNDTTGWVFGSQTNLKTGETIDIVEFSFYLEKFIAAFNDENNDLKSFIHKDIKYSFLFNPGIYCSGGPHNNIERILPNPVPVKNSFNKKPKGDFCEGYPGIKDGFYYQKISANNLPSYLEDFDEEGNVITGKIDVPKKYRNNEIKKVIVITDEYHNTYFYFINIGSTWYLFCQDFCDCSA